MKMTFHKETKVIFELSVVSGIKNNVAIIKIAKSKSTGSPTIHTISNNNFNWIW